MPVIITFEKDTPAKRLVRRSGAVGIVLALLYLVWLEMPGFVSSAARPTLQNFAVAHAAALIAIREVATTTCAGGHDVGDRTLDRDSALEAARLAHDALSAVEVPENVRAKQAQIKGRLAYATKQYGDWATRCDAAELAALDKYGEDLMIDIDALRNPTGAVAGGLK